VSVPVRRLGGIPFFIGGQQAKQDVSEAGCPGQSNQTRLFGRSATITFYFWYPSPGSAAVISQQIILSLTPS
jgi:hypothetical protein